MDEWMIVESVPNGGFNKENTMMMMMMVFVIVMAANVSLV
jgi:hypothetical protein